MARGKAWALGTTIFAATMMLVIGVFQFFQGLAAAIRGEFFFVTPNYVYAVSTTGWGWIHMALGAVLVLTGSFLFTGATWARVVGIALVALSAIANFFFLPYYPLWSLLIIVADIAIIWALATAPIGVAAGAGAAGYLAQHTAEQQMQEAGSRWPPTEQPPRRGWTGEPPKTPADRMSPQDRARQERAQRAAEASAEQRGSGGPMSG